MKKMILLTSLMATLLSIQTIVSETPQNTITSVGKASPITIRKQKSEAIKATCIAATEVVAGGEILKLQANSSNNGQIQTGKVSLKLKECRPLAKVDPNLPLAEWSECECVYFYLSEK